VLADREPHPESPAGAGEPLNIDWGRAWLNWPVPFEAYRKGIIGGRPPLATFFIIFCISLN
jgi:hypothetical protein